MSGETRSIDVRLFATLQNAVGKKVIQIQISNGVSVREFRRLVSDQAPALRKFLPNCIISINRQFARDKDIIPDDAVIAIFPPVSGGVGFPEITDVIARPIRAKKIMAKISLPTTGAIACFLGIVREITTGETTKITRSIEYQSYTEMAIEKMQQIIREIRKNWPQVEGIAIIQRTGHLKPQTPSVFIACSASHRDSGVFEASRYAIDRLKEIVPVWKKEVSPAGEKWIEGTYLPKKGD